MHGDLSKKEKKNCQDFVIICTTSSIRLHVPSGLELNYDSFSLCYLISPTVFRDHNFRSMNCFFPIVYYLGFLSRMHLLDILNAIIWPFLTMCLWIDIAKWNQGCRFSFVFSFFLSFLLGGGVHQCSWRSKRGQASVQW